MRAVLLILFIVVGNDIFCQTAKEVVQMTEDKMRGKTSEAGIIIKTIRPTWSREMQIKTWQKGTVYSIILVESPPRDKGIVYLKRKNEVWNWIPSIEKVVKLPPSMMSQSWMGTDFSNDDLVKESSMVSDYTHEFGKDTVVNNRKCYTIVMIPLQEASVVWGKLVVCIDKSDLVQLHARFYDENNVLINTMNSYDVKSIDGRMIPTRFEMIPADKKNQKTEMIYQYVHFDRPISDGFFTPEKMKTVQ